MIRECDGDVPEIVARLISRHNRQRMAGTKSLEEIPRNIWTFRTQHLFEWDNSRALTEITVHFLTTHGLVAVGPRADRGSAS